MEFVDRVLPCADCGEEFIFTAGEQVFFHDKQFVNDPKRCKKCKAKRSRGGRRVRPETRATCAGCGVETTVPFRPTQGRPVLCRVCFQKQLDAPAETTVLIPAHAPELAPEPAPAPAAIPPVVLAHALKTEPDPTPKAELELNSEPETEPAPDEVSA